MSQSGQQAIAIHILTNISRSKGNQAMKFDQLIEFSLRNILLEKSYTKCVKETIPRPFFNKSKLSISLGQYSKVLYILFLLFGKARTIEIETKLQTTCICLIQSFLKKQKEVQNQSPCLIFCMIFEEKYFSCYILLPDQILMSGCFYFVRY